MDQLTPRKWVDTSLRGGHSDRVPFTIYENKIPQCVAERELRNDIPEYRWQDSCRAIMTGLERHARQHSPLYR